MKHLRWDSPHLYVSGMPPCSALVPETDGDRKELRRALGERGVKDRRAFSLGGSGGIVHLPEELTWEEDGAARAAVTVTGEEATSPAWFWVVECAASGERSVWWATYHAPRQAAPWC